MAAQLVQPVVVQFPHPGGEHNPGKATRMPWNTGEHRRKFLQGPGRYVGDGGVLVEAPLVFWGEWEAPSCVIKRWSAEDDLPQFLHAPVWERPRFGGLRQNTDPWVFGDCFRYSNCRQLSQRRLQNLAPGTLILFGSALEPSSAARRFVIDTVFVVSEDRQRFTPADPPNTDEAFRICTVESLATDGDGMMCGSVKSCGATNSWFTLYRGATHENPVDGMYSFVPCKRADRENFRFSRPKLSLPSEIVSPASQAPNGAGNPLPRRKIQDLWKIVRDQIHSAGCLERVHFSTPPEDHREGDPRVG
jgi:hypothetical protein